MICIALFSNCGSSGSSSQSSSPAAWKGARQLGVSGAYDTFGRDIATDSSGNVFIAGYTTGALDGNTKTSDAGSNDVFITKYDVSGNKLWTRQFGTSGANDTFAYGLATDSNGNVYLAGKTTGTLSGNTKTSDAGKTDVFLTKYDTNGTQQWIRQMGTSGANNTVSTFSVATDSTGNVFFGGNTTGTLAGTTKTSNAGKNDLFVTKYDTSGVKLWTKQLGISGAFNVFGRCITTDASGNVIIAGYTTGALDGNSKTSDVGSNDLIAVKYDGSGTKLWSKQLGATGATTTLANALGSDSSGSVYVYGHTDGAVDSNAKTSDAGEFDFILTKYDSSGNKQWTKQLGTPGANSTTAAYSVAVISSGAIFIEGYTKGTFDGNTKTSDTGQNDYFIATYDSSGNKQWLKQMGQASSATAAYGIASDASDNLFIAGITTGALDGGTKTSDANYNDFFIMKFDSSGNKQ